MTYRQCTHPSLRTVQGAHRANSPCVGSDIRTLYNLRIRHHPSSPRSSVDGNDRPLAPTCSVSSDGLSTGARLEHTSKGPGHPIRAQPQQDYHDTAVKYRAKHISQNMTIQLQDPHRSLARWWFHSVQSPPSLPSAEREKREEGRVASSKRSYLCLSTSSSHLKRMRKKSIAFLPSFSFSLVINLFPKDSFRLLLLVIMVGASHSLIST